MASTLLLTLGACGGGGSGTVSTPTPLAPATPAPAPTPTPTSGTALTPSTENFATAEYNRSSGAPYHGALAAWQLGASGRGVTIGFVDSGIDVTNPEFTGRISPASADMVSNRGLQDQSGHGTQVALTAAAARDNAGVMGIAWDATLLMAKADTVGTCATSSSGNPDSGCSFSDGAIAAGIDRAVANGAAVINISLGGSNADGVLRNAVARAASAGVVIVVSAGNNGASTDPADNPLEPDPLAADLRAAGNGNVIIAGSVNGSGVISSFANRAGSQANWYLAALGERICCVYANGQISTSTNAAGQTVVTVVSGTSFSAPQITGAVALLRQAYPNMSATAVVDLLLKTARDAGAAGPDAIYGRGILDIAAAMAPQGSATLAGVTTSQMAFTDSTLSTSAAMGDATGTVQAQAVVLDAYQRAYRIDLMRNIRHAAPVERLAPSLLAPMRQVAGGNAAVRMAFSVDASRRAAGLAWSGPLRLGAADAEQARVLAGRVIARLSPATVIGFSQAQGAEGLADAVRGVDGPAFMVARSAGDDLGLARSGQLAFAMRQKLGRWGITLSAENGMVVAAAPLTTSQRVRDMRTREGFSRFGVAVDRTFGTVDFALGASWLAEDRTVLGARLHDVLGGRGADSLFLDASAAWHPGSGWRIGAAYRRAETRARLGEVVASGSRLSSDGWTVDLSRAGIFAADDMLALRVSQPLRVRSGGLNLLLPVAWDYATLSATHGTSLLSLAPQGREIATEMAWRGSLWGGSLAGSLFWRREPGHFAALRDDRGAALSWATHF